MGRYGRRDDKETPPKKYGERRRGEKNIDSSLLTRRTSLPSKTRTEQTLHTLLTRYSMRQPKQF